MEQIKGLKTGIKYKDTPIGKIPVDWEVIKLGSVSDLKNGINFKIEQKGGKGILVVDVLNMYSTSIFIDSANLYRVNINLDNKEEYILKKGDILFVRSSVKKEGVGWASLFKPFDEPVTFCGFIIRSRLIARNIIPEFLIYFLRSDKMRERLISGAGQVAITNVSQSTLQDLDIISPPLTEQKKIAEILTAVDEAIEKTDQIIEKTKEVKKGLMQKLLTRGIGHKKFKKTDIGEIPEEWEVVRLGDVCNVIGGSTPSTSKKEYWAGEIPFVTPTDITNLRGREISDTEQKITPEGLTSCGTNLLPAGSILLTSRATIGACAINTKPMATNQGFANLVCGEKTYNWFIFYKMISMQQELEMLGSGSTFKEVSKKNMRSLAISLPPLVEQKQITMILSSIDDGIVKESNHKNQLEALKKGLMQVLLTGKIRVIPSG